MRSLKNYEIGFGLWIVFAAAFILLVWIILKIIGVIKTPLIVEMIPYLTGVAIIAGFAMEFGKLVQKISYLGREVRINRKMICANSGKIADVKSELVEFDNKLTSEIKALDSKLTSEITALDTKLTKEIVTLDNKLTKEIVTLNSKLNSFVP